MLNALLTAIGEFRTHAREHADEVAEFEAHENEDVANLATYVKKRLNTSGEGSGNGG